MRLFTVPSGTRTTLLTHQVGTAAAGVTVFFDRQCLTSAIATDDFATFDGTVRRRFAGAKPPLADYTDEVWMADGPFIPAHQAAMTQTIEA
jgi:hypothetical protein